MTCVSTESSLRESVPGEASAAELLELLSQVEAASLDRTRLKRLLYGEISTEWDQAVLAHVAADAGTPVEELLPATGEPGRTPDVSLGLFPTEEPGPSTPGGPPPDREIAGDLQALTPDWPISGVRLA